MSIFKRFFYTFSILFLFIFLGIIFLFNLLNKNLVNFIEKETIERQKSFETFIDLSSKNVLSLAMDFTYWDEMIEFVNNNKDIEWAKENIEPALSIFGVDFIWVYNLNGDLVYFTTKRKEKDISPLPDINKEKLENLFSESRVKTYFLKTEYGLLKIGSATIQPTFDSERKTPPRGYFFTGKLWDNYYLDELKKNIRLNLFIDYIDNPAGFLPKDFTIKVSLPLKDHNNKEIGFLKGFREENTIKWLYEKIKTGIIFIGIFFISFLFLISFILWFWVIKPIRVITEVIIAKDEKFLEKIKINIKEISLLKDIISDYLKKDTLLLEELDFRKKAEEKLRHNSRLLYLLSEINQLVVRSTDIDKLFIDICRLLVEKGQYYMVWIGKVDKELKLVRPVAWWGYMDGYLDNINISIDSNIPEGRGPVGEAVRSGKNIVCNDIEGMACESVLRERALKRNYRSAAVFPLRKDMDIFGVLNVYSDKLNFFNEDEIKLLNELSGDISFSVDYLEKEKLIRLSEERHRLQFKEALDGIVIVDLIEDKIVDCNPAMLRLLKRNKEEVIGQPHKILYPQEVFEKRTNKTFDQYLKEKIGELLEYRIITKEKEYKDVSIKASKIEITDREYLQIIFRDITELKKIEAEIKENAEKFRALAENSPDTIMRFDRDFRHLYVNSNVEKQTGIPASSFIGKTHRELGFPEELCILWEKAIEKVFKTGMTNRVEFKLPSGIWIDWFLSPEFDENGKIKAVITAARDITEIKNKEEKLIDLQAQLFQSAKLASLGQLSSGVAHEINNPLTAILNNLQLIKILLDQKKEISFEEFKKIITYIEESALSCKKIVQNMLSFSRATKGVFDKISLNDAIKNAVSLIEFEYSLQNVYIEKNLKPDLPFIMGDIQLLQQVILDLLNNSFWAIKKKGREGKITLTTDYNQEDKKVILLVSDTGIGIPEENIGHIFEPFFTTKAPGEGTGLGLSIVYDIIRRHNATISVESKVNFGTTFKIVFPIA